MKKKGFLIKKIFFFFLGGGGGVNYHSPCMHMYSSLYFLSRWNFRFEKTFMNNKKLSNYHFFNLFRFLHKELIRSALQSTCTYFICSKTIELISKLSSHAYCAYACVETGDGRVWKIYRQRFSPPPPLLFIQHAPNVI